MNKGERTRLAILDQGMKYSSQYGLADLTIGTIAKLCQMSRTGVISHFANKEDMQLALLEHSEQQFTENVINPSRDQDALTNLTQLMHAWQNWTQALFGDKQTSCPLMKAVVEFQDRPDCKVGKFALDQQKRLLDYLTFLVQRAIYQGSLDDSVEPQSVAFELYSLTLGHAVLHDAMPADIANRCFHQSVAATLSRHAVTA